MYETVETCQVKGLSELYEKYFGYRHHGVFIDVGAADGVTWSNTYGLYRAGWEGVMFEPDVNSYKLCEKNLDAYNNVVVLNWAIGKEDRTIKLHVGGMGASTVSEEFLFAAKIGGWDDVFVDEYYVDMKSLDNALDECWIKPDEIDVLSIDTEGNEPDILLGFDIDYWKPKMVIIEAHEHYPGKDRPITYPFINKYFQDHNYKKIYSVETNNIYVQSKLD